MGAETVDVTAHGDGFLVSCVPPDPKRPPERFATFREAWGCAGGIRLVTGRAKRDLTGGDSGKAT
jgi:hypothetical protein